MRPKSRCPFRFDARWLSEEEVFNIILNYWNDGHSTSERMTACDAPNYWCIVPYLRQHFDCRFCSFWV
ncbi:hypothetical protein LINGRAHAP2_LOCUS8105 [Linum grandiflorum]